MNGSVDKPFDVLPYKDSTQYEKGLQVSFLQRFQLLEKNCFFVFRPFVVYNLHNAGG